MHGVRDPVIGVTMVDVAYDEALAQRVRSIVADLHSGPVEEKRMFGGLGFLVQGNMAVAAQSKGGLLVRVDPAETDTLLAEPGAELMAMRGREMRGWITVSRDAVDKDKDLHRWAERGIRYAASLPPK